MVRWLAAISLLLAACEPALEVIARSRGDADVADAEVAADADADADAEAGPDADLDAAVDAELDASADADAETDADVTGPEAGVTAGGSHTCTWSDGEAWCWGADGRGQLGDGEAGGDSPLPVRVLGLSGVVGVTASDRIPGQDMTGHTCAWTGDGEAWCWGANDSGQLGDGTRDASPIPVRVELEGVAGVTAGAGFTCAWTVDGGAWCWGLGDQRQLGDGATTGSLTPTAVLYVEHVATMSAGFATACAVEESRAVLCWGLRLGMGGEEDPVVVSWGTDDEALGVTVGEGHACLWQADGALYCWGWNDFGELGVGTTEPATYPVEVDLPAVERASAGGSLTCAVHPGGELACWGFQVGDPMGMVHESPFAVTGLPAIADAAAGAEHGCARGRVGGVWCWGTSTYGQLGTGRYRGEPAPVPVEL